MIKLPEPAKCEGGWESPCAYYYTEAQLKQAVRAALEEAAKVAWNHEPDIDGPIEAGIRALIKEIS